MLKKTPLFDTSYCVSCGICIQSCPVSCIRLTKPGKQGKYKNVFPEMVTDRCIGCGSCAAGCPMECITMSEQ